MHPGLEVKGLKHNVNNMSSLAVPAYIRAQNDILNIYNVDDVEEVSPVYVH